MPLKTRKFLMRGGGSGQRAKVQDAEEGRFLRGPFVLMDSSGTMAVL